jgi:hypothetical protein
MRWLLNSLVFSTVSAAWVLLPSSSTALGQTPTIACDQCATEGFYIPSLQTLVIIPLSQAGDRLEAALTGRSSVRSSPCDASIEPGRIELPSYQLDERSTGRKSIGKSSKDQDHLDDDQLAEPDRLGASLVQTADSDERNALELVPPVQWTATRHLPEPLKQNRSLDTLVRLASSRESSGSVRLTGVSPQSSEHQSKPHRPGYLKDKYLQRKRIPSAGTHPATDLRDVYPGASR